MLENGYVTLPRSIAKKDWFMENGTLRLYIVLLMNVAFKDTEVDGIPVKKGQFLTSFRKLALATDTDKQTVSKLLNRLEKAGDITVESTAKYSIITLHNGSDEPSAKTQSQTQNQTQEQTQKQTQNETRSSKVIEESKEEKSKEESKDAASPPAYPADINISLITREELVDKYGEETVARYEEKFRQWADGKPFINAKLYPTIAKWMAQDVPHAPKAPQSYPAEPTAPRMMSRSSIDISELKRRIMDFYRD